MLKDLLILLIRVQQHSIVSRLVIEIFTFHCSILLEGIDNVKATLTSFGFKELRENEQWNIQPLDKVRKKKREYTRTGPYSFSTSLLKMDLVSQRLLLVENISMEMVLL